MIRLLPVVVLAALLGACAEIRTPAPASRVPAGLGVMAGDPLPAIAADAAAAFGDAGRSLAGRPAATARAVGQGEFLAAELRRDARWAGLSTAVETELRTARIEWRAALGIRAGAAPDAVAAALGRAGVALANNDTRGAAQRDDARERGDGAPRAAARRRPVERARSRCRHARHRHRHRPAPGARPDADAVRRQPAPHPSLNLSPGP